MWGQSELFSTSTTSSWVFTIPCTLEPSLFLDYYLLLFFFSPFIVFIGWIFSVHFIKFLFHILLGAPPPIFSISGNIFPWFLDTPVFNVVKSLNITIVWVSKLIFGEGLSYVTASSLEFCKEGGFFLWLRETSY